MHYAVKKIEAYWKDHSLGWPLNASMVLLAVTGLTLALLCTGLVQDVGTNIAFMALGVLLTVYFVDAAVRKRENTRWSGVDQVAHRFLRRASTEFLNTVSHKFDPDNLDRFVITGFELRTAPETWHIKLSRDSQWRQYIEKEIAPLTVGIGYDQFQGNHLDLAQMLERYRSQLIQLWPLLSSRWSPAQTWEVLELIFEIPDEIHRLNVHVRPGVNTWPASLNSIIQRSVRLIELCNDADPPDKYILPNDPGFGQ